jgi:hypothetical protein
MNVGDEMRDAIPCAVFVSTFFLSAEAGRQTSWNNCVVSGTRAAAGAEAGFRRKDRVVRDTHVAAGAEADVRRKDRVARDTQMVSGAETAVHVR